MFEPDLKVQAPLPPPAPQLMPMASRNEGSKDDSSSERGGGPVYSLRRGQNRPITKVSLKL